MIRKLILAIIITCMMPAISIAEVIVAVTSNFYLPLIEIRNNYTKITGSNIIVISGSTGKLYTQITQGASFDIFLAADDVRPKLLEKNNFATNNSRFTYAIGKLVFWSPGNENFKSSREYLEKDTDNYIVIANPKLAPYGKAAESVLNKMGLTSKYSNKIVTAENVNQAFMYIDKKQVNKGFISLSQILQKQTGIEGENKLFWIVPDKYHDPILQQAVLLKKAKPNQEAMDFYNYLKSDAAVSLIQGYGYHTVKNS
ncbi:MAG: molybdate ABC transporter substrate-binding protein [Rickettsiaceae bacterium]|nr:molybdate ABC transporter substrate-binding protein [Rickettsiaceae bacterium]